MTLPGPVLSVTNLSKTFPGQRALSEVGLEIMPGEIRALVGQNGSGKSTLIKCLSGYYQPDPGAKIVCGGEELPVGYASSEAQGFGLAFVHQDLGVVPQLTVLENFCLGRGFVTRFPRKIRWKVEAERVGLLLREFGHSISPMSRVADLSSAEKTIVAIVRALEGIGGAQGRILVLDEPTAALPNDEVARLLKAVRGVAERGIGIIYVSHRLNEVFDLCDSATVLRDGKEVATVPTNDLSMQRLVELILGRTLSNYYPGTESGRADGDALLEVQNLCGPKVTDLSFTVARGEMVGIAGLLGSGCSEVGRLLFGVEHRSGGVVRFKGREVKYRNERQAMKDGVGLLTEDRRKDGSFGGLSVGRNMTVTDLQRFWKFGRISSRAEQREVRGLISRFDVRPPDSERAFRTLSGGNQQKAIVAKWMRINPDLLILDEPHVGIDVGSKTDIYGFTREAATAGAGVLLISSEFGDLSHMCDKVLVLRHGRVVANLAGPELTEEKIAQAAYLSDPSPQNGGGDR
jgi:ribose transport system ATP-binding protein